MADVVLGNPVGDVLMGFMDQEVRANIRIASSKRSILGCASEVSFGGSLNTSYPMWNDSIFDCSRTVQWSLPKPVSRAPQLFTLPEECAKSFCTIPIPKLGACHRLFRLPRRR